MLIYRAQHETVETSTLLAQLEHEAARLECDSSATHDRATSLLIGAGELEAAVADALCPDADDDVPALRALGRLSLAAALVFVHGSAGAAERVPAALGDLADALAACRAVVLVESGCDVATWTVRPHGHPFDRRLALAPGLSARIAERLDAHFLIVDE